MVSYHVVHGETPEIRANYIEFWIRVAAHCRDLNNFNAVMEIISALNASAVHRLKKSWGIVSRKVGSHRSLTHLFPMHPFSTPQNIRE